MTLLSSPALSSDDPQGYAWVGHSFFHDFYNTLFNRKMNVSCCNNKDCRPTSSRMVGNHYEIKLNGHWVRVPDTAIIPKTAPDSGAHICAGDPSFDDPLGKIYCVILPPET
jgi:hypothetical protein